MGVRIKTISNDIPGAVKSPDESYQVHHAKSQADSEPVNKIWELEWEVLGKKLNKNTGKASNAELDKLHAQLREKDQQLKHAEHKISELKKQLAALQDKQRAHNKPQHQHDNRRQEQRKPQSTTHEQRKPQPTTIMSPAAAAAAAKPMAGVQKSPNKGGFRR